MKQELWGPIGVFAGILVTGIVAVLSEKIKKRVRPEDIALTTSTVWEKINAQRDADQQRANEKWQACEASMRLMNEHQKARDLATWDYLEKRDDKDETSDRIIAMLERIALRVMTAEEREEYALASAEHLRYREQLDEVDRALRATLFR